MSVLVSGSATANLLGRFLGRVVCCTWALLVDGKWSRGCGGDLSRCCGSMVPVARAVAVRRLQRRCIRCVRCHRPASALGLPDTSALRGRRFGRPVQDYATSLPYVPVHRAYRCLSSSPAGTSADPSVSDTGRASVVGRGGLCLPCARMRTSTAGTSSSLNGPTLVKI